MIYRKQTLCNWQLIQIFPLMNRNCQHLHCCSLVLAYSWRSWLQSSLPSIQSWALLDTELFLATGTKICLMYSKYSQCNIAVPTVNIPKPRRFKVVFMNRMNKYYCCPSYVTKACHVTFWQKRPLMVQNQNNKQAIANDPKSESSCLHVLCNDVIWFHPAKKYHSSLYWDCIPFFVECNQSEKPVQRRL